MEKYSAYRDPGTGIQPFLTPVPPLGSDFLAKATLPLRLIIGVLRTALLLLLGCVYIFLVPGLCIVFAPVPPAHRTITHLLTAIFARLGLLLLGFPWISVEHVTRKRGRGQKQQEAWNPQAGDIIVSNWVSWIELLWLAYRFNPVFVLPVSDNLPPSAPMNSPSPITHTPGRRTGTGSANIQAPAKITTARIPIVGFRKASLLTLLRLTGSVPSSIPSEIQPFSSLESIRQKAGRPIVVFPECTTSNGRGLLRFANVFQKTIPVKEYQILVMCVRYDPPTSLSPTLTRSIPSNSFNPLPHIFSLASSITLPSMSIRLLAPSDSPSSPLFIASEVVTGSPGEDQLSEACAALIAQIGKMKRTGMGWEDKANLLQFYQDQRRSQVI